MKYTSLIPNDLFFGSQLAFSNFEISMSLMQFIYLTLSFGYKSKEDSICLVSLEWLYPLSLSQSCHLASVVSMNCGPHLISRSWFLL